LNRFFKYSTYKYTNNYRKLIGKPLFDIDNIGVVSAKIKNLLDSYGNSESPLLITDLENQLKQNPNDKNIRFELSIRLLQSNFIERGFQELLILFDQDSKWNDSAAKRKLLEYFDLLGFNDPNVMDARKKLSSMMFK